VFAQQNPAVIDKGVFHNDVIAVGNRNVLLYHEEAFLASDTVLQEIQAKLGETPLIPLCIRSDDLTVEEAVGSYLFNSQLVTLDDSSMALIVPQECRTSARASAVLDALLDDAGNPIKQVIAMDLKQSMRNGGGPACLRLRVALNIDELNAVKRCIVTPALLDTLEAWVERHYRESLTMDDLSDPALLQESRSALHELTGLLGLGSIYDFQR
jgi:succinylarginine dihydrolase